MSTIEKPFLDVLQEIIIKPDGTIIGGNNTIYNLESFSNLFEVDPFFESLKEQFLTSNKTFFVYPCVNFYINNKKCYCDVTVKRENGFLAFILFNYSERYEKLHNIESQKNQQQLNAHLKKIGATNVL
ncbi:hypothetical protein [Ulvibacter antarcticus]|uniref:PAS domain-containing protein n=1 Tax=Ulvibacter antarcticus TaxID=442714 RepID=A0A3L9Z0Z7_9FLAO|nr:hypothetical protein [Ulvibacter antarcticus]RMA66184.1 hypothetical protein BXY75_0603 [Ulvibacter antarcticus]